MGRRRLFEAQLVGWSLVASIPLLFGILAVMVYAEISIWTILLTLLISVFLIIYSSYQIHHSLVFQLQTLSGLLGAMSQGDYSLRARGSQGSGELENLVVSINGLAQRLSQQRQESIESQILANTVIDHIDVAIIALNESNDVSFLNPAAKNLLHMDEKTSTDRLIEQLAFVQELPSGSNEVVELTLGHQQGKFNVHVEEFREAGVQNRLLFIADVRTLLRGEERRAWQDLVRVIGHEINNSLTPIASISQTLRQLVADQDFTSSKIEDINNGLTIITERANGLSHFVDSYKQLARLPKPNKTSVSILDVFQKIKRLFGNHVIKINSDVNHVLQVDPALFEQVLINLFKNAIDAMSHLPTTSIITVEWHATESIVRIIICDNGSGIVNSDNVFVPFYSTKKPASGIGLALSRQIIEAHHGRLFLTNREDTSGCCATIELPLTT